MLTIAGTLAVVVAVAVGAFVVPGMLAPSPTAPVAVATSTAVEPASTIRVTEASPSATTPAPATPASSAARDAVTEQVKLADQLLAQYPAPTANQAMIDELKIARDTAQALLDDPATSEAKLITANSTLSGHNQAFRVHALTAESSTSADGQGVVAAPVAEQPQQDPAPQPQADAPVQAPSAPTAERASQSISVTCQAPSAFSITFTASGGGKVELSAAGQSATGAGSASVTASGNPGQSFSASGSADGSVSVSYSSGGAACS